MVTAADGATNRRAWPYAIAVGLLAVSLRLALLPIVPIPVPTVHDEFSYLLGGDTLASGHLTNPPHPLWRFFETFHVNPLPTYCSKYPPGQALFLAIGERLAGNPWYGVCLSIGVMFAAIQWMLEGWVNRKYALLTALLGLLGWGVTGMWINSYWGGAVAAAGGALVIGAIPRLIQGERTTAALLGSAGLVILANSRPFEGLLTAAAAAGVLVWRLHRSDQRMTTLLKARVLAPLLLVMVPAAGAMAYYNYRTTGNVLLMPYTVNQRMYSASPFFFVLPPVATPAYRHENIRHFWVDWVLPDYIEARKQPWGPMERSGMAMVPFFFFNPFVLAILAGLLLAWGPELRAALVILAAPTVGLMFADAALPHYLAPAFGAFLIVGALGLQRACRWQAAAPILVAAMVGVSIGWCGLMIKREARLARQTPTGVATRPMLMKMLRAQGGQHLVIVRYSADHNFHDEWIYNRANIDESEIVWAQDMSPEANRQLLQYYKERKIWLLEPDSDPLTLKTYTQPPS